MMTRVSTPTEAGTSTEALLLYVAIDLGRRPGLEDYGRNVASLMTLARYATVLSTATLARWRPEEDALPLARVRVVRTSLASPWISVLGDLARSSAPIGYGVTAVYALHRLLQLVMTWQQHRLDLAERRLQLQQLQTQLLLDHTQLAVHPDPATAVLQDAEPLPPSLAEALAKRRTVTEAEDTTRETATDSPFLDEVFPATEGLGEILAAEMVDPQDPRATGST